MNTFDELAAWLQERESYYAELALRHAGKKGLERKCARYLAKSHAFGECLHEFWKLQRRTHA
jgi:hypothetical protein